MIMGLVDGHVAALRDDHTDGDHIVYAALFIDHGQHGQERCDFDVRKYFCENVCRIRVTFDIAYS